MHPKNISDVDVKFRVSLYFISFLSYYSHNHTLNLLSHDRYVYSMSMIFLAVSVDAPVAEVLRRVSQEFVRKRALLDRRNPLQEAMLEGCGMKPVVGPEKEGAHQKNHEQASYVW